MNHINVTEVKTQYGYTENYWTIDGVDLPTLLDLHVKDTDDDYIKSEIKSFAGLCPAWNLDLEWRGDVRFVWKLIGMDSVTLPLLLCEDDKDFTCIVVVVEMEKNSDFVYWNRIGYVLHDNENFDDEKKSGIMDLEKYSEDDWEKYGDNIALAEIDSKEWRQWINEHWDEELYRRRMNYTLPYYKKAENIKWFVQTDWVFDCNEYESMVDKFRKAQCKKYLSRLKEDTVDKIDIHKSAGILADVLPNGEKVLEEHLMNYGEVLLHVLASELITEPLIESLNHSDRNAELIEIYCETIELLWLHGDDLVVNVVDVTVLERLSDNHETWKRFGTYITEDFKQYINEDVLINNLMMSGVMRLE
ncbi:MAG: hypothetical protein IJ079_09910 [Lachnospiraceae bacterium]|nr:hypothetical protein [Lachnospiraceae bacterium]